MQNRSIIADMVRDAEVHADELSKDRIRAIEYYQGIMKDTPADKGRSKAVTRDLRAQVKKVRPSIKRVLFGSSKVVEYQPVGPEDEESAKQATDYVNRVIIPEAHVKRAILDAVEDALVVRNGIIRWWWDKRRCVKISRHSGLTDDAFGQLAGADNVDIIEHTEREEQTEIGPVMVHDCTLRRVEYKAQAKVAAVPRERFLIHKEAVNIEGAILVGEKCKVTRSDLISMDYDADVINGLPVGDGDDEEERDIRRDHVSETDEATRANEQIDYYDLFVRFDEDGDGIAELRHMCFAGGLTEANLLLNEECDEVQYCDVAIMRQPHQWEAISLADDLLDIQRAKTILLRQTLDNIYWQNSPQPYVQGGAIRNMEAVYNPEFGKPIETKPGISIRDAIGFNQVPFVAKESFAMMGYLDAEAEDRTGVSDASAGLSPDALQNVTAKASAMMEQSGIGQTEELVETVADSLAPLFRGLLRLIARHQDVKRTIRLRNEWVEMDPRHWNADLDVEVNTGLGAGTRERDMQMMQLIMGLQEKLLAAFGAAGNPYVKPDDLWAAISKTVEAAGLTNVDAYFTEPDEDEVAAMVERAKAQPSPEEQRIQGQMQLEQMKMQSNQAKEKAQMDADLMVKRAEMEATTKAQADELAVKERLAAQQLSWERERFERELRFKSAEIAATRQDEIWKAQAAGLEVANNV